MWEQHIDIKDRVREAIYSMLYESEYKFSATKSRDSLDLSEDDGVVDGVRPDGPTPGGTGDSRKVKPYVPVSTEAELMKVLDAPMGG